MIMVCNNVWIYIFVLIMSDVRRNKRIKECSNMQILEFDIKCLISNNLTFFPGNNVKMGGHCFINNVKK